MAPPGASEQIRATELAGYRIERILTKAPGDGNPIGGVKLISAGGWFAARPSGTEEIYKIYAESSRSREHLAKIQEQAREMIAHLRRSNFSTLYSTSIPAGGAQQILSALKIIAGEDGTDIGTKSALHMRPCSRKMMILRGQNPDGS